MVFQEGAVVSKGATLDETVKNIQEAESLHLEGEDLAGFHGPCAPDALCRLERETLQEQGQVGAVRPPGRVSGGG